MFPERGHEDKLIVTVLIHINSDCYEVTQAKRVHFQKLQPSLYTTDFVCNYKEMPSDEVNCNN